MKSLTFTAPSYTRTLMHQYDFKVPSIKSSCSREFKKFVNVKKDKVERTLNVDSCVEYNNDGSAYVRFVPMFTENWGSGKIETDIVLGNLDVIEIWMDCRIIANTGKPYFRELSSVNRFSDTIIIDRYNDYDKDLFTLTKGNQLGKELIDKQDQIEELIKDYKDDIEIVFYNMLQKLQDIKNTLIS